MTEEELQELCDALRNTHPSRLLSARAAEVIEYLVDKTRRLAQSDAESVKQIEDAPTATPFIPTWEEPYRQVAAPPRPDASAGLIEAAEWLEQRAPACYAATTAREWAAELRKEVAVRARAADRNRK